MPNHVTTVCTVAGEPAEVAAFIAAHIRTERGRDGQPFEVFDFDTIVPMPQCVKDTCRNGPPYIGDAAVEYYAQALLHHRAEFVVPRCRWLPLEVQQWGDLIEYYERTEPTVQKWARAALACAAETGCSGWYDWSCKNWGTKWGSYDFKRRASKPDQFVFEFQTAWSVPRPVLAKLAEMHPQLDIDTESIDEGGGPEFAGHYSGGKGGIETVPENRERYLRVYGRAPYSDEDEASAAN